MRGTNLREADKILEIYSDDLGKVRAVARGLRKIQSRLAGHLEPFTYVDLMLAQGRGDLATVTGAKALEHYAALRRDLKSVASASYIAELVSRLSPEKEANRYFPMLLRHSFRALDSGHDHLRVTSYFEWQALHLAGWEPILHDCVHCHAHLYPQGLRFSFSLGGVLCKQCSAADPNSKPVNPEVVKLLRCYSERPFNEVEGLLVGEGVRKETQSIVDDVVTYTLDRVPKSRAFLNHLEIA